MSYVANLIVITAPDDGVVNNHFDSHTVYKLGEKLKEIQQFGPKVVAFVYGESGGNKAMECDVFLSAINVLDVDAFLVAVQEIEWEVPESVQILLKNENDEKFRDITPSLVGSKR